MRLYLATGLLVLLVGAALPAGAATAPFTLRIDPAVRPSQPRIAGLDRTPPDPIGAIVDGAGHRVEMTVDELVVQPRTDADLQTVLRRYAGRVERTEPSRRHLPWRLVRIPPRRADPASLSRAMTAVGVSGSHRASSAAVGGLLDAIAALRRAGIPATFNRLLYPAGGGTFVRECCILENPLPGGSFTDFAQDPRFSDTGMGIGVVKAWDYLRYKGIPCCNPYVRPLIAIVDGGFALDPVTGMPSPPNPDFTGPGGRPRQFNTDDVTSTSAGGENPNLCSGGAACPFHGTQVFSTAAAFPRNHFGAAGTGGDVVDVLLVKTRLLSFDVGYAIEGAGQQHPAVINLSFGADCLGQVCGIGTLYDAMTLVRLGIDEALAWSPNTVVVAAAMNSHVEIKEEKDGVPCAYATVICVGATATSAKAETFSNFGSKVTMWAPDGLPTTIDPGSGGSIVAFSGTSSAAPFLSGIVGLMKALAPDLDRAHVLAILRGTALPSTDPLVTTGYVNAYAAVQAVRPNQPPSITIRQPAAGATVSASGTELAASIEDPEQDPRVDGMTVLWQSDKQAAPLCTGTPDIACDSAPLVPGVHHITATVTDPYGATATAAVTVTAGPSTNAAYITWPPNNATYYADQRVPLRGYATIAGDPASALQYRWTSDRVNGNLGYGAPLLQSLPVGPNVVTLYAAGPHGSAAATVAITVLRAVDVPDVHVTAPADGAAVGYSQPVTLVTDAADPADGVLDGSAVVWSSDVDGMLGTGASLMRTLTGGRCAPVRHRITVTATNAAKRTASDTITLFVGSIC